MWLFLHANKYNVKMPSCVLRYCFSHSRKSKKSEGVIFHRFLRHGHEKREAWIQFVQKNRNEETWLPTEHTYICSLHFKEDDKYRTKTGRFFLKRSAVPNDDKSVYQPPAPAHGCSGLSVVKCHSMEPISEPVSEQEAQPGPSNALGRRTPLDSDASREQDPLSGTIEQCRFCGEFNKDCVAVSDGMPYLASNKTTLALNDTSVQLDFNNQSLPNTVCRDCDAKLQEFADFVKVVKAAQDTLINVAEEREVGGTKIEFEVVKPKVEIETETLVIKTEYDSQHEESDDEKEDKDGIVDSISVGETVVVKKPVSHKRKSDAVTAKPKKLKSNECDSELIIDIKEEIIEEEDGQVQSGVSDSDVKPSELELATSALVFEMAGEGTSEYQGYRSDR